MFQVITRSRPPECVSTLTHQISPSKHWLSSETVARRNHPIIYDTTQPRAHGVHLQRMKYHRDAADSRSTRAGCLAPNCRSFPPHLRETFVEGNSVDLRRRHHGQDIAEKRQGRFIWMKYGPTIKPTNARVLATFGLGALIFLMHSQEVIIQHTLAHTACISRHVTAETRPPVRPGLGALLIMDPSYIF